VKPVDVLTEIDIERPVDVGRIGPSIADLRVRDPESPV
jgi:hypothetical protein